MKMNVTVKCRLMEYAIEAAYVEMEETCTLRQALSKYIMQGSELWKVKIIIGENYERTYVQLPDLDLFVKEYKFDEAGTTLEAVVFVPLDFRHTDFDYKEAYEAVMDSPQQTIDLARDRYFNILAKWVQTPLYLLPLDVLIIIKEPATPFESKLYYDVIAKSINIYFKVDDSQTEKKKIFTPSEDTIDQSLYICAIFNEEENAECFQLTYNAETDDELKTHHLVSKLCFKNLLIEVTKFLRERRRMDWIEYKPVAFTSVSYCTSCVPNDEEEEQDDENLNVPYYPIF